MAPPDHSADQRRLTLEDVARALGISKSTVSLALRGSPRVKDATSRRVHEMAKQMGYCPDPLLSAYSQRRRKQGLGSFHATIAVIWPDSGGSSSLWASTLEQVRQLGYQVDDFYLSDYPTVQRLASVLHARGIPALLVPDHPHQGTMEGFPWEEFQCVQCGVGRMELPVPIVRYDSFATMKLAWEKMREAGARRIGTVLARHAAEISLLDAKTIAAAHYMQSQVDPERETRVEPLVGTVDDVFREFPGWFEKNRPDGVIGPWPGFYDGNKEELRPRVGFAGYVALRADGGKNVAGCTVHRRDVEQVAINYLDALIRQGQSKPKKPQQLNIVLEPEWHPGLSLRQMREKTPASTPG